jgi:hypothetical protein
MHVHSYTLRVRRGREEAKNIISAVFTALCSVPRIPIHLFICSSAHLFIWIGRKPPGKTGFVQ